MLAFFLCQASLYIQLYLIPLEHHPILASLLVFFFLRDVYAFTLMPSGGFLKIGT